MAFIGALDDKHRRRARRSLCGFVAVGCALVFGCAAPADGGATAAPGGAAADKQPVQQIRAALTFCPNTVTCTTNQTAVTSSASQTKSILTDTKDLLTILGGFLTDKPNPANIAAGIVQFVSDAFFGSPAAANVAASINCLSDVDQCLAQGLDWTTTEIAWQDDQYSPMQTAMTNIQNGFAIGSNYDYGSQNATQDSGGPGMFARVYVPSATDGDGKWKSIVTNSAPEAMGNGAVFDWQAGFSRFTAMIPQRLAIIAYLDPNFQRDGSRTPEIAGTEGYLPTLQGWLTMMKNGVTCDYKDRNGVTSGTVETDGGRYAYTDVACADVNSGISAETRYTDSSAANCLECEYPPNGGICVTDPNCLQSVTGYDGLELLAADPLRRAVEAQMPFFEVHSMIDSLYHITHPVPDLTTTMGRIPVKANHALCLDVQWANPASGTPVWIWGCNGTTAQQWSYNRQTTTITNVAFGKCLQVRPNADGSDNRAEGAAAEISDCVSPVPLRQQWTYDPQIGVIRSALNTVLDIQANNRQAGTMVVLADDQDYLIDRSEQSWYADPPVVGDSNGDGMTDIRLTGAAWGNIPIALNQGNGSFYGGAWSIDVPDFINVWSTSPNVKALAGDFDGDGLSDVALTGASGWWTIPVAFANNSDGSFRVTNLSLDDTEFAGWAASPNVWAVTGDFNGDGRTDVALTGGAGWWTIPVAFSNGDGSFHVTDQSVWTAFNNYATVAGARPVVGDFNGDGLTDIAIMPGEWETYAIPVALSNGDGNFTVQIESVTSGDTNFVEYAAQPGVQAIAGDFNGDGLGDIALVGGAGWGSIPVAYSTNGTFSCTDGGIAWGDGNFLTYANGAGVKAVGGDFNKDGKSDIALTGGSGWWTIPIAYSLGDTTFGVNNISTSGANFPGQAATAGVSAVGGGY